MRSLKLGLALGAGGTKGAAHVGVMRVLDDAGIRAGVVAGTSIGSLYGGCYAVGRSPHEMEEGIRVCPSSEVISFFRHRLRIRHNNRLALRFYEALAGHHIENLPITYAATASDIVARQSVTITEGPIIDAIEASIAIPVLARPVAHQGRYLLDGGFWDAAPVDAAQALGADVIVAVELGQPYQLPPGLREPAMWLADRLDWVALKRTIAGVPFTIHAVANELKPGRTAHVVLRPKMGKVRGNSPFHMTECLDAGIAAATEALPAIRALLAGDPATMVAEEFVPEQPRVLTEPGLAGLA
jgi:predicted acylesterase/phospholipase RssA